jgi:fructokinase
MSKQAATPKLVCYGEILWDLLPTGALPGGAPMNVAYHLNKLQRDVSLITTIGSDAYGTALLDLLSKWGIGTAYCHTTNWYPTGIVHAQQNDNFEMTYDIVYPSAWDFITWDDRYISLMQEADYLVFGSLACRNYTSGNTLFKLLESAKKKVLDINIRPPHFSRTVLEQLLQQTDILKLNQAELELIAGWYSPVQEVTGKMQLIQDRFLIDTLVVTLGDKGALLCMDGNCYQHPGYQVRVADTVGSGDAFLAAFLSLFIDRAPPQTILDFACAMGALIASYQGACPDYHTEEINTLKEKNNKRTTKNFSNQN